jgi:hypothetical protein
MMKVFDQSFRLNAKCPASNTLVGGLESWSGSNGVQRTRRAGDGQNHHTVGSSKA